MDKFTEIINQINVALEEKEKELNEVGKEFDQNSATIGSLIDDINDLNEKKEVLEAKPKIIGTMCLFSLVPIWIINIFPNLFTFVVSTAFGWPIIVNYILAAVYFALSLYAPYAVNKKDFKKEIEIFKNYKIDEILKELSEKEKNKNEIEEKNNVLSERFFKLTSLISSLKSELSEIIEKRHNVIDNIVDENVAIEEKINNAFDNDESLSSIINSENIKRALSKQN